MAAELRGLAEKSIQEKEICRKCPEAETFIAMLRAQHSASNSFLREIQCEALAKIHQEWLEWAEKIHAHYNGYIADTRNNYERLLAENRAQAVTACSEQVCSLLTLLRNARWVS